MKPHEFAVIMSGCHATIDKAVTEVIDSLVKELVFSGTNAEVDQAITIQEAMASYSIYSNLKSKYTKFTDTTKKELDALMSSTDAPDAVPGETTLVYSNDVLRFSKKVNVSTETVSAKDLTTELSKLGVDPALVKKATEKATKERKGNTYYNIEVA